MAALLPVFFETLVPADSWSFCSSLQVLLDSWTALLIILFTTLSKMLLGVDDCHDLQIIQTHLAYLFIMTFRLPTEIIRGIIKNLASNKNGRNILLNSVFPKYSQCFLQKHKFSLFIANMVVQHIILNSLAQVDMVTSYVYSLLTFALFVTW